MTAVVGEETVAVAAVVAVAAKQFAVGGTFVVEVAAAAAAAVIVGQPVVRESGATADDKDYSAVPCCTSVEIAVFGQTFP